ncbi:hypothetical protein PTSG_07278 [Salpingoeca rosetta]|uniref:Peptidase M12B domain-containing protein n=1 Tax=Salpingoeca rosetta (strain ATCC 50818 / BSB-021) TaxID=946362 RepID=F2UIY9_SALR5|nr:uncharacterized protein PTSG_07278 [Salpingoeca rosetta]EGD76937.1 hypothetical protein PTSG_07278 [Salpingoeca rosetta]|eukprot:XP_004990777.1 hypothetical protein PTSG_07278 [Salpingoeca rosetta]
MAKVARAWWVLVLAMLVVAALAGGVAGAGQEHGGGGGGGGNSTGTSGGSPLDKFLHTYSIGSLKERGRRTVGGRTVRQITLAINDEMYALEVQPDHAAFQHGIRSRVVGRDGVRNLHVDTSRHVIGHVVGYPQSNVLLYLNDGHGTGHVHLNETHKYYMEPAFRHIDEYNQDRSRRAVVVYRASDLKPDALPPTFCGLSHDHDHGHAHHRDHRDHHDNHDNDHDSVHQPSSSSSSSTGSGSNRRRFAGPRHPSVQRVRRDAAQPATTNTCLMRAVGDSAFVARHGGDADEATQQMISFIRAADSRFRVTDWGNNLTHLGLAVVDTLVYEDSSTDPYESSKWQTGSTLIADDLLIAFAKDSDNGDFCLAHLFTNYDFDLGVLGLANVGTYDNVGGLCATVDAQGNSPNTGLTTEVNFGTQQPFLLLSLVTTHEVGHNWGAQHDAQGDPVCNPPEADGGSYVMFATSVDGSSPNNDKFSPCSIANVRVVLESPKTDCFSMTPGGACGNYIVDAAGLDGMAGTDDDEECDAGPLGDNCCTAECKLAPGVTCSDANDVCCDSCSFNPNKVCFQSFMTDKQCRATALCGDNGNTNFSTCPDTGYQPLGTICLSLGECVEADDGCMLCCIHNSNETATPYCPRGYRWQSLFNTDVMSDELACFPSTAAGQNVTNSTDRATALTPFAPAQSEEAVCTPAYEVLTSPTYDYVINGDDGDAEAPTAVNLVKSPGSFCDGGRCNTMGTCEQDDAYKNIVNFFESLTPEQLLSWGRSNIIATCMIATLLIWIPAGLCITFYDKKNMEN